MLHLNSGTFVPQTLGITPQVLPFSDTPPNHVIAAKPKKRKRAKNPVVSVSLNHLCDDTWLVMFFRQDKTFESYRVISRKHRLILAQLIANLAQHGAAKIIPENTGWQAIINARCKGLYVPPQDKQGVQSW